MKKWIGRINFNQKEIGLPTGMFVEISEVPETNVCEQYYDIDLYYTYGDKKESYERSRARTINAAKKYINKDRDQKASDWTWEVIEE